MKSKVKDLIQEYEAAVTGVELLSDAGIILRNVRVNKTTARADVIEKDYDSKSEVRRNGCTYKIAELEEFHKTRVLPK